MKDRMLFVSLLVACLLHIMLLFLNFGWPNQSIADPAPSIEVSLVAPAQTEPGSEEVTASGPKPSKVLRPSTKPESKSRVVAVLEPKSLAHPEPVHTAEEGVEIPAVRAADESILPTVPEIEKVPVGVTQLSGDNALTDTPVAMGDGERSGQSYGEGFGGWPQSGAQGISNGKVSASSPAYLHNPKPEYPRAARQAGHEGTVTLLVEVFPNGRTGEVRVDKTSGHELLDKAAIEAVRKWRFVAAKKGANPAAAWVKIPVEFSLED
ncbi:energy transducer TonB [Candidatus Poribacteria bacterium]|nr:energy transducer TonB [Candidatus Poribacteria bacterium]